MKPNYRKPCLHAAMRASMALVDVIPVDGYITVPAKLWGELLRQFRCIPTDLCETCRGRLLARRYAAFAAKIPELRKQGRARIRIPQRAA
jgi:hypothetical protein